MCTVFLADRKDGRRVLNIKHKLVHGWDDLDEGQIDPDSETVLSNCNPDND